MASVTLRKGDDHTIHGRVTNTNAGVTAAQDITGWVFWFYVKRRWQDADAQAVLSKATGGDITTVSGPEGTFDIRIRASDFASMPNAERTPLLYDIQARKPDMTIQTLGQGDLVVLGDVTNLTS